MVLGSALMLRSAFSIRVGEGALLQANVSALSSGDGMCGDSAVQMGGSGDGAWGIVSRISADGVSRMQFWWQTNALKCV